MGVGEVGLLGMAGRKRERAADERRPFRDGAVTGRRNFPTPDGQGQSLAEYATPGRGVLGQLAWRQGVTVPALDAVAGGAPLPARLNADRWVVVCPDCHDASFVWPETPLFLCAYCFNRAAGGLWRRVALPNADDLEEIEEVTGFRPLPHQRNWEPGQSVDDLRLENEERGDHVPKPKRSRPGSTGDLARLRAQREADRREAERAAAAQAAAAVRAPEPLALPEPPDAPREEP